mmetsp:Transcript_2240/g.3866  ORF Transcript_2240/g.3866 Transcript_2240/m.3866 type:complete len:117 (+) Transcript_2240:120-470(+)
MAFGPIVRILMQVGATAGVAVGRALIQAYKEAAAGRGPAAAQRLVRKRMTADEAQKVLELEGTALDEAKIQERFDVLHKLNATTDEFAGSPYLQARILVARQVLIDEHVAKAKKEE